MSIGAKVNIDTRGFKSVVSEAKTRGITLKGVKAGVRVLQAAAKAEAPRRPGSGALKAAQGVLAKKGRKGTTISFAVQGARKRVVRYVKLRKYKSPQKVVPAFYDHLVQGGTKPHRLGKGESIGRAARGRQKARAATKQLTGKKHPGTQPNPYRQRAWNAVKNEVASETLRAMGEELRKIVAKSAVKGK